jgi:hypothetical protein
LIVAIATRESVQIAKVIPRLSLRELLEALTGALYMRTCLVEAGVSTLRVGIVERCVSESV